jgi:hypothetical protein
MNPTTPASSKKFIARGLTALFIAILLIAGFVLYTNLHVDTIAKLNASLSGSDCSNSSYILEGTAANLDQRGSLPRYDLTDQTGTVKIMIRRGTEPPKAGSKVRVNAAVICEGSGVTAFGVIAEINRREISN